MKHLIPVEYSVPKRLGFLQKLREMPTRLGNASGMHEFASTHKPPQLKQNHNNRTRLKKPSHPFAPLSRRRSRRRPPRGDGQQQPLSGVAGRGPECRRRCLRRRMVVLGRRRRLQRRHRRRLVPPLTPRYVRRITPAFVPPSRLLRCVCPRKLGFLTGHGLVRVLRLVRGAHGQLREPGGHQRQLLLTLRRLRVEGETLAFYFIRGVICLIGWGSGVFGSRCTYRYGTICLDWHCWCPIVCVCVSEWVDLLDVSV
ncbi:uncharacterized protein LOC133921920 isoform X1 [Phragmites australis]|uniref:uncharacterized protein LOC133921920 isoform X1 n=1 Tax=Phragmites australis TaxID=29695 RepID=UPI002D77CBC9|nr:uncharacterized protein LOC133921920 isoform X1 [Phragmites australis]